MSLLTKNPLETSILLCSEKDIIRDINLTNDPIKKIILQKLLDCKVYYIQKNKIESDKICSELSQFLNKQQKNDNRQDIYKKIIEDNKKEESNKSQWNKIYDPKYIKYAKEDAMNNKLMERLNSEIDFRHDDISKLNIEKPFNDYIDESDTTELLAKYD